MICNNCGEVAFTVDCGKNTVYFCNDDACDWLHITRNKKRIAKGQKTLPISDDARMQ